MCRFVLRTTLWDAIWQRFCIYTTETIRHGQYWWNARTDQLIPIGSLSSAKSNLCITRWFKGVDDWIGLTFISSFLTRNRCTKRATNYNAQKAKVLNHEFKPKAYSIGIPVKWRLRLYSKYSLLDVEDDVKDIEISGLEPCKKLKGQQRLRLRSLLIDL